MTNESKTPFFSIVTVSFNSAKTIEKTIKSVLNQTCQNFEYIIIDGGSTDETLEVIKKYQDQISFWCSEKDKGISDAFNKGISRARGDVIGILNSDDWYEENTLEIVEKIFYSDKADVVIGSLNYHNSENNIIRLQKPDTRFAIKIKYRMPHLNHPASFFTKKTYQDIGVFNLSYKYAMDYDLFLRAYLSGKKFVFTDLILSNMLMGGAANSNRLKAYWEVFKISKNKIFGFMWFIISFVKYLVLMFKR